jgi:hypothetical protein
MKLNTTGLDNGSSVWTPDSCAQNQRLIAPSGREPARSRTARSAGMVKVANEPASAPLPNTPTAAPALGAGPPPVEVPSAAAVGASALAESLRIPERPFSAFGSISQFKDAQRMATLLTHSHIVPEAYRGDDHLGDCVIALEIANRIGTSILAVMQNLRLIQGQPGWSSQFLISCVNATKRFSAIRYQMTGTRGEDSWGCIAWAIDRTGERLESPEITLQMAKAEGWYDRPDSKWRTMPELMLRYRSATLFARLYAPEITMGIQTTEEVMEMGREGSGHGRRPVLATVPSQPKFEPKSSTQPQQKAATELPPLPTPGDQRPNGAPGLESAAVQSPVAPASPQPAPPSEMGHYNYLKALIGLIGLSRHSEADVLIFLRIARKCDESLASLAEVAEQQPGVIVWTHDGWKSVDQELTRLKQNKRL